MDPKPSPPSPAPTEIRGTPQYAGFICMCLIWGTTFLVIRVGNEAISPLWGATLRLVIAAVLNGFVALLARSPWPRGAALRGIALFGFLNLGVNFALLYHAELTVPSGIAAVLYATMPLSAGIFSALLGLHPLERTKMIAALVGLAGVALIFSGEIRLGAPPLALLGVFTGASCASLSGVILKRIPPQSTFVVNAVGAVVGAMTCFIASVVLGETRAIPTTWSAWGPILYLATLGNLGAYVLWAWLVTQWKVTSVTVGALIVPVIAVCVGALVRSEAPAPLTYVGAALVLGGVAFALFAPTGEGQRPPSQAR